MGNQVEEMIRRGQELLDKNLDNENVEVKKWEYDSRNLVRAMFDKNSKEDKAMRTNGISGKLNILKFINEKHEEKQVITNNPQIIVNVNQTQITNLKNEISFSILLKIENSNLSKDQKEDAKEILNQVQEECEKKDTNWKKVTNLLKKSLDYGMKIAPDIIKLADTYYNAKG